MILPSWACASLWYAPDPVPNPRTRAGGDPLAPAYARVTYRQWRLCTLCQIMTQKAAAERMRRPCPICCTGSSRVRHGHKIRGLTTLGVDEISFCKGRKFATLVYDLDRARVLWVGSGKGRTPSIASSTTG